LRALRPCDNQVWLLQSEIYFGVDWLRLRSAVNRAWLELPLLQGLDSLVIQAHPERPPDLDVGGMAGFIDNEGERNQALPLGSSSFFGVVGRWLMDGYRQGAEGPACLLEAFGEGDFAALCGAPASASATGAGRRYRHLQAAVRPHAPEEAEMLVELFHGCCAASADSLVSISPSRMGNCA